MWQFANNHPGSLVLIVLLVGLTIDGIVFHLSYRRKK